MLQLLHTLGIMFMAAALSMTINAGRRSDDISWYSVTKWYVEAESETLPLSNEPTRSKGSNSERALSRRIVLATSDNQLAYFAGHPDPIGGIDWRNEPFGLELRIHNQEIVKQYTFNRLIESTRLPYGSEIPDPIRRDALFFFFPSWPLKKYPAPYIESPRMLFTVGEAMQSDEYELLDDRELVDEQWCRLIRSKTHLDTIWISEDHDLCVMRREWYVDRLKTTKGRLLSGALRQVAPGLWLPESVEISYFSVDENTQREELIARKKTTIIQCLIDDAIPMDLMRVALPPGTIRRTTARTVTQIRLGGKDHLQNIAQFCRAHLGLPHRKPTLESSAIIVSQLLLAVTAGYISGFVVYSAIEWCMSRSKVMKRISARKSMPFAKG